MEGFILAIVMFFSMMAGNSMPAEQSATYVNVPNMAYTWAEPINTDMLMLKMMAQAITSSIRWSDYESQEVKISWDEGWKSFGWLEGSTVSLKKKSDGGIYLGLHLVQANEGRSYQDFSERIQGMFGDDFKLETWTETSTSVTSDFEIQLF